MTLWHIRVVKRLEDSRIFQQVVLAGAKVRGIVKESLFLEVYYYPITKSYSYALVDLTLPEKGDKRVFGWDDYPHEGVQDIRSLSSFPHHFQRRRKGGWIFEESPMTGNIEKDIEIVLGTLREYLKEEKRGV